MAEVSVVVPFRGTWSTLVPLLTSLNTQTMRQKLEIVLSVDGWDEAPREIVQLADVVVNGEQKGPAAARNRGWRRTGAEYVLFTDSDCLPESQWAEKMVGKLREGYEAVKGVYSCGGHKLIQRLAQVEFEERYSILRKSESIYLADTYSAGFARSWLEKLDGFDETFPFPEHEDVDLSWRLIEAGGMIAFEPDARVRHTHRSGWISYFRMKFRRGKWRLKLVKRFPAKMVNDRYTPQTLKLQMLFSFPTLVSLAFLFSRPVLAAVFWGGYTVLCTPLLLTAFRTDPLLVPFVPVFAVWRGLALSLGAFRGAVGVVE